MRPESETDLTTPSAQLEEMLAAAQRAAGPFGAMTGPARAQALEAVAAALESSAEELIEVAKAETNLPQARLEGELKRTAFQLRLFGETIRDGSYLQVRIDHPDAQWPMGAPRPDLRRYLRPVGPTAVFAASNFPFAFSVAGGDTASALAAGNPVILKAHPGHPRLSDLTGSLVQRALEGAGAPKGTFAVVHGRDAGAALIQDSRIKAAGFTGSIAGGRALFDLAVSRPDPIPFYGELGSNNPVFVTPKAATERAAEIAEGFIGSYTMGAGQFCTKPGTLFVPADSELAKALRSSTLPAVHPMLNTGIEEGYTRVLGELRYHADVSEIAQGEPQDAGQAPTLLLTTAKALLEDPKVLQAECFGPAALVVEYADWEQALSAAASFEGQLTTSIFGEDDCPVSELVETLAGISGRVIWNQWPTGVSVTYAQNHGGPYPATTAPLTTSVGTAAIERFLRPVAFQNLPTHLLPEPLREGAGAEVPQSIDGASAG